VMQADRWNQLHTTEAVTVQLLGREDLSVDDAETADEKWRQYIESYIMVSRGSNTNYRDRKRGMQADPRNRFILPRECHKELMLLS